MRSSLLTLFISVSVVACIQPQKKTGDDAERASGEEPDNGDEPGQGGGEDVEEGPAEPGANWGDSGRGGVEPEPEKEPDPEFDMSKVCGDAQDLIVDGTQPKDGVYVIKGRTKDEDHLQGSCAGDRGAGGADVVIRFDAPKAGMWRIETLADDTHFDSLIHVRTTCDDPDTELACNDDILEGRIRNSRVDVRLDEGVTAWIVVDAWGDSENGEFALAAWQVPTLEPGSECDPQGEESVCSEDHFCKVPEEAFGEERFIPGECVLSETPVLESATARLVGQNLLISVVGSDGSADVLGMSIQFMNEGRPIVMGRRGPGRDTFEMGFDDSVYGEETFEAMRTIEELSQMGAMDGIRVALLDSEGNNSEWLELAIEKAPELEPGERCDLREVDNICAGEGVCVRPADGEGDLDPTLGVCQVPTRPAIAAVEAYLNERTNAVGLRVMGTDPDRDVTGATVRLFNEDGRRVPSSPDGAGAPGTEMDLVFGDVQWDGDQFVASVSKAVPADWRGIHSVRLRVYDAADLHSDQAEAEFRATPELEEGAACDAAGGLRACPQDQICDPATSMCGEPIAECPGDWEVIDLEDHAHDNNRYVYRGDTNGAANHGAGSCGGGAGQDVFIFTPPVAGEWLFETDIEGRFDDTVMYIRSHCRYDGPTTELACNDDVEAGRMTASRIGLLLDAEETVYVFVDGWVGEGSRWQGEYTLVVSHR